MVLDSDIAVDSPCRQMKYMAFIERHKKGDVGICLLAYPVSQALALPNQKDKQRQLAHACMIYNLSLPGIGVPDRLCVGI